MNSTLSILTVFQCLTDAEVLEDVDTRPGEGALTQSESRRVRAPGGTLAVGRVHAGNTRLLQSEVMLRHTDRQLSLFLSHS